jgi:glutathione S-transferase
MQLSSSIKKVAIQRPQLSRRPIKRIAITPVTTAAAVPISSLIQINPSYGYVLVSVALTGLANVWMALKVVSARKEFNIAYPAMYAEGNSESANKFNCVQRGHQNSLETLPMLLALECTLGMQHPITAAIFGAVWTVARVLYMLGYSTGDPKKRGFGGIMSSLTLLGLIFTSLVVGVRMATGI